MSNYVALFQHEHEEKIAQYCALNNIEFNIANAYDTTMQAFSTCPIVQPTYNKDTKELEEHDVTQRVARQIECQDKTVARIAEKIDLYKIKNKKQQREANIQKATIAASPNIDKLIDNLYRLNIVDGQSYLALVCFLMQLVHSRNNEFQENDKTCVFFNGVARNGKSATAKAIMDVEEEYGEVFKAQSGKLLESTHEEQVWKSHLNYFDEVKPTDIDRELLLTIINGGDVELNPKNKRHYTYHVNTNNIFTSNDQINLIQRRVSIIKFGNRLNGRPLGVGTLKEIIANIMEALPDFKHYYDIFDIVSKYNESRLNPLAIETILTFMSKKLGFVNAADGRTLTTTIVFSSHDIYNCYKDKFNKQIIPSERRDAIQAALTYLVGKKLISEDPYDNCTTKYYRVSGNNYLEIAEIFSKLNSKYEVNVKILKTELYALFAPYYSDQPLTNKTDSDEQDDIPVIEFHKTFAPDGKLIKIVDDTVYHNLSMLKKAPITLTADVKNKGICLFQNLLKMLEDLKSGIELKDFPFGETQTIEQILNEYITEDICKYVSFGALRDYLENRYLEKSEVQIMKNLYMKHLHLTNEEDLENFEKYKLDELPEGLPEGMTIEDKWSYNYRINKEKKEKQRFEAAIKRQEQYQQELKEAIKKEEEEERRRQQVSDIVAKNCEKSLLSKDGLEKPVA